MEELLRQLVNTLCWKRAAGCFIAVTDSKVKEELKAVNERTRPPPPKAPPGAPAREPWNRHRF